MSLELSRNAQLLKFFAQQDRGIPRKRLTKMAYMCDVIALEYLGEQVSEFEYRWDLFGPYPPAMPDAVSELETANLGWSREQEAGEDGVSWKRLYDSGKPIAFDFTLGQHEVLAYVVANYLPMPMDELLDDVVYQTTPFVRRGVFRERLPMELSRNVGRNRVGFDLEAVARAEKQVETGQSMTGPEFFDDLRDRLTRRYTA